MMTMARTGGIVAVAASILAACGSGGGIDAGDDATEDTVDVATDDGAQDPGQDEDLVDDGEDGSAADCTEDSDCDDGDPCTADSCDEDFGTCDHGAVDADGDGFAAAEVDGEDCGGTDCDDADGDSYPGAAPDCTGARDADCDGLDDPDEDSDGHLSTTCGGDDCDDGDPEAFQGAPPYGCPEDHDCNGLADQDNDGDLEMSEECGGEDCDDGDGDVHPGAAEVPCNGRDDDCNGELSLAEDADQDGWARIACVAVGDAYDCDEADRGVHPGAAEACDMVDDDCDGSWADGGADDDLDGHLDGECGGDDCDDADPAAYAGAAAGCGIADLDCNGAPDQDDDGDGHVATTCGGDDCDDSDPETHAGVVPGCWEEDRNCNGAPDQDDDGDGHARAVCGGDDCDDASPAILPGAIDGCNGIDDDCDGVADEPVPFGSDLRVTESAGIASRPDVEWSGSEFGVAWDDSRIAGYGTYFARISAGGAKIGSDVRISPEYSLALRASLAWDGSGYAVAWDDTSDIQLRRIAADGSPVGTQTNVSRTPQASSSAVVVWAGSVFGIAWDEADPSGTGKEIYFQRLLADGTGIGSAANVSGAAGDSVEPDLAWTGSGFAVAWNDDRDGRMYDVYLELTSATGVPAGSATRLTLVPGGGPALAWTGSVLGAFWWESGSIIYGSMLAGDGSTIADRVECNSDSSSSSLVPAAAAGGGGFVVTWDSYVSSSWDILYAGIGADGARVGSDQRITSDPGSSMQSSIAWSGSSFGVEWEDDRDGDSEIYFNILLACP